MARKKKSSELARSKPGMSRVNEEPKKNVVNKGKKKVKPDPVFKEDELLDSEDAVSDESGAEESCSDDGGSEDGDSEDVEEGEASEEEPEPNRDGYEDLLIRLLQEKVEKGKRKGGTSAQKQTAKRAKQKVEKTKGEEVKEKGVVVKTHSRNTQKAPNLHGVKAFTTTVKKFDDSRKKLVTEMGFGGLLSIPLTFVPLKFVYWLLTRVMGDGSMTFGDEYVLPLSAVQVECVLGIPMGSKALPCTIPEDKQAEHSRILEKFGKNDSISLVAALGALIRKDEEGNVLPLSDDEKADFKIAFLIAALGYILCATKNTSYLRVKLVPSLLVYDEADEYDWCTYVFKWMVAAARSFQKKFGRDGYVAGLGGCIIFLMIFYLDHLSRVLICWGLRPRIEAWSEEKINDAVGDDKKESGDFGKLASLNIAYGEEHPLTPREVPMQRVDRVGVQQRVERVDVQQTTQDVDVENITQQVLDRITPKLMSVIDLKLGEVMKSMHQLMSQCVDVANSQRVIRGKPMEREVLVHENLSAEKHDVVIGEDQYLGSWLLEKEQLEQGKEGFGEGTSTDTVPGEDDLDRVVQKIAVDPLFVGDGGEVKVVRDESKVVRDESKVVRVDAEDDEGVVLEFHSCSDTEVEDEKMDLGPEIVVGLVGTRGTTVLVDVGCNLPNYSSDEEDECTGKGDGTADKRVVKPTEAALSTMFTNVSNTRRHSTLEARLLQFVKRWKDLKDPLSPGIVLIKCDHMEANQRDCFEVVHHKSRVSSDYVRMASVLYTKQWATKDFVNRSKRILLDPSFSNRLLLNEGKEQHIGNKYGKFLLSYKLSQIRAVFVPVLEVPKDSPDESHWWCLALDMKARKLWMIDSMYPDPFTTHAKEFDLLVSGIDILFQMCEPEWKTGQLTSWMRCTVEILEPRDNSYCGVLMLACIKFFARRFTVRFSVGKIPNARANLFLDDVQCEVNELKDSLGDFIPGSRKTTRNL